MKREYTSPVIEITKFHTEDIITASSVSSDALPEAEIPPILDAGDIFYGS